MDNKTLVCLKEREVLKGCEEELLRQIKCAAVGFEQALLVTVDNKVFRIKDGGGAPLPVSSFCSSVKSLEMGYLKYFILTDNNEPYISNNNTETALQFYNICTEYNIKQFSCGWLMSAVLTVEGKIFYFFNNSDTTEVEPKNLSQDSTMWTSVVCGGYLIAAIDDENKLFVWRRSESSKTIQERLYMKDNVKQVACGDDHFIALTHAGKMFIWGDNSSGQLGLGHERDEQQLVELTSIKQKILHVGSQIDTSCCITEDNQVYVWGEYKDQDYLVPTHLPDVTTLQEIYNTLINAVIKPPSYISANCLSTSETPTHPTNLSSQWEKDLLEMLGLDSKYADFTITVQGQNIHTISMILIWRSKYFKTLFDTTLNEKETNVLEVINYSYKVFKIYITYLCSDRLNITPDTALELYSLAHDHLDDDLMKLCSNYLKTKIFLDNVVEIYKIALLYEDKNLKDNTISFIKENYKELAKANKFKALDSIEMMNELLLIILD